jgi:ribosomal protein S18 acetylase RimI-like enzyme
MDDLFNRNDRDGPPQLEPMALAPSKAGVGARWVPIRSLKARHAARVLEHLQRLGERDRYLRFGYAASNEQIARYVEQLDFAHDELFGIFNRRLDLVAIAHLAYMDDSSPRAAEFGVSVADGSRGRGYGDRLFDHAALHARNRGVDHLLVHALSENTAMLRIVRNAGACIERDGAESRAWVRLAPANLVSQVEALVEDTAADLDYRLKQVSLSAPGRA